jgi:hypothetical protein
MKLSSRKQLLKESESTLKSIKKSLNEDRISVKGKMIQEPKQYVVRCHTQPSKWVRNTGFGKNMKVGYYLTYEQQGEGRPVGTNDINKAHVFKNTNPFPWDDTYDEAEELGEFFGDYFEPLPVEVKRIVTIKK